MGVLPRLVDHVGLQNRDVQPVHMGWHVSLLDLHISGYRNCGSSLDFSVQNIGKAILVDRTR
jgi:hypothetical protein